MARELAISTYLFIFRMLFNLFKLVPQKKKTVCVASFGDNIFYTVRTLHNVSDQNIVILKELSCKYPFDPAVGSVIPFSLKHPFAYMQSIYHLATAKTILIDNYFGFLAVTNFRAGTICIQLWHAVGAIKQFGLLDPTNENRSPKALKRFQQVYDRFHYVVTGSEKMAAIFRKSFGLNSDRILRTGVPRSDFFFDEQKKKEISRNAKINFPGLRDKKIILYAPTYRRKQLANNLTALDIKQLYNELSDEYVLFIKPHPAESHSLDDAYSNFVYDVSHYKDTNALLLIADMLITDYSSIPFEFALLEKPMIFFAHDMAAYKKTSGLIDDYVNIMPGPVVASTSEIIEAVKKKAFDRKKVKLFALDWNEYSKGNSSMNVAGLIEETEQKEKAFV